MKTTQEIAAIIAALKELYPDAACSLDYGKDYELLFSVRLAAQCTDARVNLVTPALFQRYPTLEAFADADVDEVGAASSPAASGGPRRGTSWPPPSNCWRGSAERSPTTWRTC